jgi:hypothetical protein
MTVTNKSPVEGQLRRRTYVTCLQCGEELAYNWQEMKIEGPCRVLPLQAPAVISIARGRDNVYQPDLTGAPGNLTQAEAGH